MTLTELKQTLRAEEDLAQELSGYAGCWVAIDDCVVVASAPTLEALLTNVDPEGLDRILEVSREPTAGCFF